MPSDNDECIHLLHPDTCSICNPSRVAARKQETRERQFAIAAGALPAQYRGHCEQCDEWWAVGELIVWSYADDLWAHWGCRDAIR